MAASFSLLAVRTAAAFSAFAALAFHKQQDASPTGLQRLGNGLSEICSVLDTALTETLDDVSRLQPLVKRRAAFFHFGDNHPAHIFVKAKFSRKLADGVYWSLAQS